MSITGVVPQLRTTNIDNSISFYVDKLGFVLDFRYEDFYAGIRVGNQFFHLKLVDERDPSIDFVAKGEHVHLYFPTEDVATFACELEEKGVVLLKPVAQTPWGTKEFYVEDDQGHVLCFGQGL